jgi:hypothetical protein
MGGLWLQCEQENNNNKGMWRGPVGRRQKKQQCQEVCIGPHCRHLSISGYEESSSTRWPHPALLFHLSLHHTLNRLFICLKYHRLLWVNRYPPPLSPKFLLWLGWMAQGAPGLGWTSTHIGTTLTIAGYHPWWYLVWKPSHRFSLDWELVIWNLTFEKTIDTLIGY